MRDQFAARRCSLLILALLAVYAFDTRPAAAISVNVGGDFQVLGGATCPPSCTFEGAKNFAPGGILNFSGTVTETIVPATSAKLVLTDFAVINAGTATVDTDVIFRSSNFAAIGPPAKGTVHLDGNYSNRGGQIRDAHAGLTGLANTTEIGFVDGSHVLNSGVVVSIPFTDPVTGQSPPPDKTKELGIAVTFLVGDLSLHIAPSDRIRLPDSGTVAVEAVPEPATLFLLSTTMAALEWVRRGRRDRLRVRNRLSTHVS